MDLFPLIEHARPHLKKNSIDNYIRNINILHNKKPYDNLDWLKDTESQQQQPIQLQRLSTTTYSDRCMLRPCARLASSISAMHCPAGGKEWSLFNSQYSCKVG